MTNHMLPPPPRPPPKKKKKGEKKGKKRKKIVQRVQKLAGTYGNVFQSTEQWHSIGDWGSPLAH